MQRGKKSWKNMENTKSHEEDAYIVSCNKMHGREDLFVWRDAKASQRIFVFLFHCGNKDDRPLFEMTMEKGLGCCLYVKKMIQKNVKHTTNWCLTSTASPNVGPVPKSYLLLTCTLFRYFSSNKKWKRTHHRQEAITDCNQRCQSR